MSGIPIIKSYPMPSTADLPDCLLDWRVDVERAVLLIHDMQEYFLRPLPISLRSQLTHNTAVLRHRADHFAMPVAYTAQPGGMAPSVRGLLADIWGPGMTASDDDRRILADLRPRPRDWTFTKLRYSAFVRSDLLDRMQSHKKDQLIICGVYAHVGVLMTAVDAFQNDIQPFLVADATADLSAEHHHLALDYAAQRCAVVVTTSDMLT